MRTMRFTGALAMAGLILAFGAGATEAKQPKPKESLTAFAARFGTAIATGDCATITAINKNSGVSFGCPRTDPKAAQALANFRVVGAKAYGTGGVIDFTSASNPAGATAQVSLGFNGQWGIDRAFNVNKPTIGTAANKRGAQSAAKKFLAALKAKDCDGFFKYSQTDSQSKKTACKKELPLYKNVTKALKATKKPSLKYMGGNGVFTFFSLETSKPGKAYRTVAVAKTQNGNVPFIVLQTVEGPKP